MQPSFRHQQTIAINPAELYDPRPNGYSHVVIAPANARWIFVAGQGGEDASGLLANGFNSQLQRCLSNLRIALAAADASLQHVVRLTVLVVDHDQQRLDLISKALRKAWGDHHTPACTLMPVPRLALDGMLVEIDATACISATEATAA